MKLCLILMLLTISVSLAEDQHHHHQQSKSQLRGNRTRRNRERHQRLPWQTSGAGDDLRRASSETMPQQSRQTMKPVGNGPMQRNPNRDHRREFCRLKIQCNIWSDEQLFSSGNKNRASDGKRKIDVYAKITEKVISFD